MVMIEKKRQVETPMEYFLSGKALKDLKNLANSMDGDGVKIGLARKMLEEIIEKLEKDHPVDEPMS